MKTEILRLLRDQDSYVSGQQLCEQFGVSRTAVWKVINQLKEEGYQVEAIRNKGYRIVNQPDLMTQEEIQSRIADSTKWAGQSLHVYPVTDSTNIQIMKQIQFLKTNTCLVVLATCRKRFEWLFFLTKV